MRCPNCDNALDEHTILCPYCDTAIDRCDCPPQSDEMDKNPMSGKNYAIVVVGIGAVIMLGILLTTFLR
ncbi:MAG: hypothetical protein FWE46_02940 [Coriobacteriia bacterium]|nr:hypothetical protein [Coriobacteriia bacterium]MCL2537354.1 hypothetical protein [Coriobacteriia bacterium]